ncbi:peroxidase family protein [Lichenihabitans psoromatis]|uniref:peroxidase family protein n=1 Tax=Lichenihabitans psoromatis TaxID=2528642 RepID=UPI00103698A9|nr:peroxidase family protein [Lichenihabitans psoromatis]
MSASAHGFIGSHLQPFTELLPLKMAMFDPHKLLQLSKMMKADFDTVKDGPDPEENLWVPAGYTYFAQFVDHDLTFDSTSSLNPADRPPQGSHIPSNLRTPRFDLDNVYGDGPDAQPFMYDSDGATILTGTNDLLRAPNGRAIIGDKRNDENSIVCQIQLGMIRYHNTIVAALKTEPPETWNVPNDLFASAQNEVRWTYHLILVHDLLPRIIKHEVLADLEGHTPHERKGAYALYTQEKRANLPREFVGAAYRYGHSGVRFGYRLNTMTRLSIFKGTQPPVVDDSLLGFDPLPTTHVIDDWGRFFPASAPGADIGLTGRVAAGDDPDPKVQLQYAYKLDPTIVDPLAVLPLIVPEPHAADQAAAAIAPDALPTYPGQDGPNPLPSLALLNLLRGNTYGIATGQSFVHALQLAGKPVTVIDPHRIVVRVSTDATPVGDDPNAPDKPQAFQWTAPPEDFATRTPLWFYMLAEAQAPIVQAIPGDTSRVFTETQLLNGPGALSQLGWVGGRIIGEVFYALLDEDADSVFNHPAAHGFVPRFARGPGGLIYMRNLLDFK